MDEAKNISEEIEQQKRSRGRLLRLRYMLGYNHPNTGGLKTDIYGTDLLPTPSHKLGKIRSPKEPKNPQGMDLFHKKLAVLNHKQMSVRKSRLKTQLMKIARGNEICRLMTPKKAKRHRRRLNQTLDHTEGVYKNKEHYFSREFGTSRDNSKCSQSLDLAAFGGIFNTSSRLFSNKLKTKNPLFLEFVD